MTQVVNVPGVGKLNFPDGMSQQEMAAAIQRNYPQIHQAPQEPPPLPNGGPTSRVNLTPTQIQALPANIRDARNNQIMQDYAGQQYREGMDTVQGAASAASAVPANLAAGLNMSASLVGGRGVDDSLARFEKTRNALTYEPSSKGAQAVANTINVANALPDTAGQKLGDYAEEKGASPMVSTIARMTPDVLAALVGARARVKAGEVPEQPAPKAPIPTTQELREATTAAYKRANDSGVVVPAEKFAKAVDEIAANAKDEAIDPVLHPKSTRVLQRLEEAKGKDLSLKEAENLRRIALEAEGDVNQVGQQSADGMRAGKIVDDLDEKIDALSANDEARALNRRKMNSQLLDVIMTRAENNAGANFTQAGMEHALRLQFKQLANNPARMKRFNAEQAAAIQKVARGGRIENTLRLLGKAAPTGIIPAAGGVTMGGAVGGPIGAAVVPALGAVSKFAARKMTQANVNAAREAMVGRGLPTEQAIAEALVNNNRNAVGRILPPQRLALPAPTIEQNGNFVADSSGRTSRTADLIDAYLRQTGQEGLGNVRQPKAEPMPEQQRVIAESLADSRVRKVTEIRSDLQRIEQQIHSLTPEQYQDGATIQALSAEWARLQAELKRRGSRAASSSPSDEQRRK